jgi:pimeloyl-ACP methyl ester carboxylesterase
MGWVAGGAGCGLDALPRDVLLGHLRPVEQYAVETLPGERRGALEMRRYLVSGVRYRGAEVCLSLRVCLFDPAASPIVLSIPGGGGSFPDDALWWLAGRFQTNQAAVDWIGRGQSPAHDAIECLYDPIFMDSDDVSESYLFHDLAAIWAALNWLFHIGLRPVDLVGGSWGGVLCFLLAALDPRVERIFSSFGCGGFALPGVEKRSMWDAAFEHMGRGRVAAWCAAFDPLLRMADVGAGVYYETATNDKFFSIDMAMETWRRVRNPIFLGILPNRDHDMRPFGVQPYVVQRLAADDVARCRALTEQRVDWDPGRGEVRCAAPDDGDKRPGAVIASEQLPAHGNMSREWVAHEPIGPAPSSRGDGGWRCALQRSDPAASVLYFAHGRVTSEGGDTLHAATPIRPAAWQAGEYRAQKSPGGGILLDARGGDPLDAPIGDKMNPAIRAVPAGWSIEFAGMRRSRATRFGVGKWQLPSAWQTIEIVLAAPADDVVDKLDLVLSRRYQLFDEEAVLQPFRDAAVTRAGDLGIYCFAREGFAPAVIVEPRFRAPALPEADAVLADFDAIGLADVDGRAAGAVVLVAIAIR